MPREFESNNTAREKADPSARNRLIRAETPSNDTFSTSAPEKGSTAKENFAIENVTKKGKEVSPLTPSTTKEATKTSSSEQTVFAREAKTLSEDVTAIRKKQFKEDAASGRLSEFFNGIITETREKDPEASVLTVYQKVADSLPTTIDSEFQKKTLADISSDDPRIRKSAEQNFLLMNTKGVLSVVKSGLVGKEATQEDVVQAAFTTLYTNLHRIDPEKHVLPQIRSLIRGTAARTAADLENIPQEWVYNGKAGKIIETVDSFIEKNGPERISAGGVDIVAEKLSKATGQDKEQLHTFIEKRQASAVEQEDTPGEDTTTEKVMEHALWEEIGNVIKTMPEKQRQAIQLQYGENMEPEKVQKEMGQNASQVRTWTRKAFNKLDHEFRSPRLRDLDPNYDPTLFEQMQDRQERRSDH